MGAVGVKADGVLGALLGDGLRPAALPAELVWPSPFVIDCDCPMPVMAWWVGTAPVIPVLACRSVPGGLADELRAVAGPRRLAESLLFAHSGDRCRGTAGVGSTAVRSCPCGVGSTSIVVGLAGSGMRPDGAGLPPLTATLPMLDGASDASGAVDLADVGPSARAAEGWTCVVGHSRCISASVGSSWLASSLVVPKGEVIDRNIKPSTAACGSKPSGVGGSGDRPDWAGLSGRSPDSSALVRLGVESATHAW